MRQVNLAAAQNLLSPFSSPVFGVKFLSDFGFCLRQDIDLGFDYRPGTLAGLFAESEPGK